MTELVFLQIPRVHSLSGQVIQSSRAGINHLTTNVLVISRPIICFVLTGFYMKAELVQI